MEDSSPIYFNCPFFNAKIMLENNRIKHILYRHPELRDIYKVKIKDTLLKPDVVRKSERSNYIFLFSRW